MLHPSLRAGVGRLLVLAVGLPLSALLALSGLAGCGLISSDVTNFDLTLPDKKFTIDTGSWQIDQTAANLYLIQACTTSSTCSSQVQLACKTGCTGSCSTTHTCDLSLDVSLSQPVDLVMEKPELKSINDEPVIKVAIDSVTYEVKTNTLNVDTPEVTIYVAPTSVLKPSDSMAKAIGTIPPVPAGQVTTSPQPIMFTSTGKADLVNIMSTFKTPFNVLAGASILVSAGDPVPMGKLDAVVHIKGHAGL
jgi:hypothetical protein